MSIRRRALPRPVIAARDRALLTGCPDCGHLAWTYPDRDTVSHVTSRAAFTCDLEADE